MSTCRKEDEREGCRAAILNSPLFGQSCSDLSERYTLSSYLVLPELLIVGNSVPWDSFMFRHIVNQQVHPTSCYEESCVW